MISKHFLLSSIILSYLLIFHQIYLFSIKIGIKSSNRRLLEEDSDNEEADYPPLTGRSATSAVSNSQAPPYPPGTTYSLFISHTLFLSFHLSHSLSLPPNISLLFMTFYRKLFSSFINKFIAIAFKKILLRYYQPFNYFFSSLFLSFLIPLLCFTFLAFNLTFKLPNKSRQDLLIVSN